jgi:hypothetical protein
LVVTGEVGYAGPLTNVAACTTSEGASGSYTLTTWIPYLYYLPLVMKP